MWEREGFGGVIRYQPCLLLEAIRMRRYGSEDAHTSQAQNFRTSKSQSKPKSKTTRQTVAKTIPTVVHTRK